MLKLKDGTLEVLISEIHGETSVFSNGKLIIEAYKDKLTKEYYIIDFSVQNINSSTSTDYNTAINTMFCNIANIYEKVKYFHKKHAEIGFLYYYDMFREFIKQFDDAHCGCNRDGTLWVRVRI